MRKIPSGKICGRGSKQSSTSSWRGARSFDELDARFRSGVRAAISYEQSKASSLDSDSMPPIVDDFVKFYSGPARGFYARAVQRFEQYHPMIREIFAREGVPMELAWIGLVESGYNPVARSRRAAVGIWQLIPATASRYGLAVGPRTDRRTDPVMSTLAAARFLRHLYNAFGDWNLVLAAYNSGEERVSEAIARGGTTDFWELARRQLLPRETRDYVPAAVLLGRTSPDLKEAEPATLVADPRDTWRSTRSAAAAEHWD